MAGSSQLFITQSTSPLQGLTPCIIFAREPSLCKSGWSQGSASCVGLLIITGKKAPGALSAPHQNFCPLGTGSEECGEFLRFAFSSFPEMSVFRVCSTKKTEGKKSNMSGLTKKLMDSFILKYLPDYFSLGETERC